MGIMLTEEQISKIWKGRKILLNILHERITGEERNTSQEGINTDLDIFTNAEVFAVIERMGYEWNSKLKVWISPD